MRKINQVHKSIIEEYEEKKTRSTKGAILQDTVQSAGTWGRNAVVVQWTNDRAKENHTILAVRCIENKIEGYHTGLTIHCKCDEGEQLCTEMAIRDGSTIHTSGQELAVRGGSTVHTSGRRKLTIHIEPIQGKGK